MGSVNNEPVAYINVEERKLEWAAPVEWGTPTIARMDKVPLYTHQYADLTDEQIDSCAYRTGMWCDGTPDSWDMEAIRDFSRAILKEAQSD